MPRRRLIACPRCHHLLLRGENYCDVCGSMTARQRARIAAQAIPAAALLAAVLVMYFGFGR
jgi:uncharacterized paraquat-inducible protein A